MMKKKKIYKEIDNFYSKKKVEKRIKGNFLKNIRVCKWYRKTMQGENRLNRKLKAELEKNSIISNCWFELFLLHKTNTYTLFLQNVKQTSIKVVKRTPWNIVSINLFMGHFVCKLLRLLRGRPSLDTAP
jgi:hypothetical protein